jgi:TonB family protein
MSLLETKDGNDPQKSPAAVETSAPGETPVIKFVKDPQQQAMVIPSLFGTGYGAYEVRPENFLLSFLTHALAIGALLWLFHLTVRVPDKLEHFNATSIVLSPPPLMHVGTRAGGGGGGGEASKLKASAGSPPKATMEQQLAPPVVVAQQKSKLMVTPTIVADMKIPQTSQVGDPLSKLMTPSSGTGVTSGIGNGSGGGVGSGDGRGLGPGSGANFGGGVFHVGNGISAPIPTYSPDPDYSDEARKVKHQGTVILNVIVGTDGRVHNPKIVRSLGMGLDEKAIEKVLIWRFDPARKDGRPVAVEVNVEVSFNLY